MGAWNELVSKFDSHGDDQAAQTWLTGELQSELNKISNLRGGSNVIFYASAFLQKPQVKKQQLLVIDAEDINGLMSVVYGMDCARPLTLLLHTPGGSPNAAETLHSYVRSKFTAVEVVVPVYAFSAGTMLALGADKIVMGRQSQLGPIDPQMFIPGTGRYLSAQAIVDQFDQAKEEIGQDTKLAHAWLPILQSIGPGLLVEARNALAYGEEMVCRALRTYMLRGQPHAGRQASRIARHFNKARVHRSHGRRIDRDEARTHHVKVEDLEASQDLQDAVLTAYHLMTIAFEKSQATKMIISNHDRWWVKSSSDAIAQVTKQHQGPVPGPAPKAVPAPAPAPQPVPAPNHAGETVEAAPAST